MSLAPEIDPDVQNSTRARRAATRTIGNAEPFDRVGAATLSRPLLVVVAPPFSARRANPVVPVRERAQRARTATLLRADPVRPARPGLPVPQWAPTALATAPTEPLAVPVAAVALLPRAVEVILAGPRSPAGAQDLAAARQAPRTWPVPAGGVGQSNPDRVQSVPSQRTVPARLTVRGRVALAVGSVAVAAGIVLGAWFSAPQPAPAAAAPAQVVVHDGDTLWSVAAKVAPRRDPRAVVADLMRVNKLPDVTLIPGQVLRTR